MLDITAEVTPAYVLDSYALLAYFQAEVGAPMVRTLFEAARDQQAALYLSLINAGEIYYLTYRERGPKWAEMLLKDLRRLPIVLGQTTEERVSQWLALRLSIRSRTLMLLRFLWRLRLVLL